jgi:DNA helicase-2/ATP-dependent DNA helicase PcrA
MAEFDQAGDGGGVASFLEQVALVSDLERGETGREAVTLMTLHAAKGLEFPMVFMVGMEERLFPHARALDDNEQMEEERRLCYVGMTRAMKRLFLSNARRRRVFGQDQMNPPSRFISEIPDDLIDMEEQRTPPASTWGSTGWGRSAVTQPQHNLGSVLAQTPDESPFPEVEVVPDDQSGVVLGMKVRHGKFGVGVIRRIEGSGDEQKVIVWFNSVGPKKLLVRFAGLERV